MLEVDHISFNYGNQHYFKGIRNVSLKVGQGEVLALVGKSGSGKTTLIKCIYGLDDLQSGEIRMNGERVTGPSCNLMPGHPDMSLVSQDFYVLDNHSVKENITDKLIGLTDEFKNRRSAQLMKLLELTPLQNVKARFLSSGQKQRVAIARALAIIPQLLLLDEPFSNLDRILTDKLYDFVLKEVKRTGTSVILITHQPEDVLKYAHRICMLDEGKIVQSGEKWKVYYKPNNTKLAGLLGEYNVIRKEDLMPESRKQVKAKMIFRSDRIMTGAGAGLKLPLTILNCTYNGKCFEVLAETQNGNSVVFYSMKEVVGQKEIVVRLQVTS